jgi:thiamine kinase-like enzyme
MSKLPATRHFPGKTVEEIPDPYRRLLSDDARIVLTHADLHASNIIVCKTEPHRVLAIIDWGQSGWFPDYWEFCKAEYTVLFESEWRAKYILRFLEESDERCIEGFESYAHAYGY